MQIPAELVLYPRVAEIQRCFTSFRGCPLFCQAGELALQRPDEMYRGS